MVGETRAAKTSLACNTCRKRKSRCDGLRPSCSHCIAIGAVCHYRTTPTNLETDSSVLNRLDAVEARLDALEKPSSAIAETSPPREVQSKRSLSNESGAGQIPDFHHGACHKMMQYWSRLRLRLTIPDFDVLTYLQYADSRDERFTHLVLASNDCDVIPALLPRSGDELSRINQNAFQQLPISLVMLLMRPDLFPWNQVSFKIATLANRAQEMNTGIRLADLCVEELLYCTIALHLGTGLEFGLDTSATSAMTEMAFTLALQRLWMLDLKDDLASISTKLAVSLFFLHIFGNPSRTLAMLHTIDPLIDRYFRINGNKRQRSAESTISQIYYLVQSDILSEVDGSPSSRMPIIPSEPYLISSIHPGSESQLESQMTNFPNVADADYRRPCETSKDELLVHRFEAIIRLRATLNRILKQLYATEQAYCRPEQVGPIVAQISLELESWYYALPLNFQFSRDATAFKTSTCSLDPQLGEVAIRFYGCMMILKRPILYYVLYQNLEASAATTTRSPEGIPSLDNHHHPNNAWVFAACHDCIENAKLIILTLARQNSYMSTLERPVLRRPGWYETQLVVGSYAVLLSLKISPSLALSTGLLYSALDEISELLDLAEDILSRAARSSLGFAQTLDALRNIRCNNLQSPASSLYSDTMRF